MGEYWTDKKGEQLAKLGVMDDWRYVTRAEAEAIYPHDGGHNTDVGHALRDPSTLWRFPWPDEVGLLRYIQRDGGSLDRLADAINRRDMSRTISWAPPSELVRALRHGHRVVHFSCDPGGGYGVNVWVPCLAGPEPFPFRSSPVGSLPVTIYGERYDAAGRARTIFRCGYCDEPFSLTDSELPAFRVSLLDHAPRRCYASDPDRAEHARHFAWYEAVANAMRPAVPLAVAP